VQAGAYTSERMVVSYPKELREEVEEIAAYDAISRSPDVSEESRIAARLKVAQICAKHNPKLNYALANERS
jgi:metal-responsive CopG/Arc/MetJ family transcriptional regulator